MTHDQIVQEIIRRAHKIGVLSHYCRESQRCLGDRGTPDLLLVGHYRAAFIEVKTPACPTLSSNQVTWMHAIKASGGIHYVLGAEALDNGVVGQILDYLMGGATPLLAA